MEGLGRPFHERAYILRMLGVFSLLLVLPHGAPRAPGAVVLLVLPFLGRGAQGAPLHVTYRHVCAKAFAYDNHRLPKLVAGNGF